MPPIDAILARLLSLHPKRIDLSLDRMLRLLKRLGHPERRVPPVIHVAGTNGKGSTIAFMRAILEAGGRTAHVYTSPHLVRFNERIRLGAAGGGVLASDDAIAEALAECERANDDAPITVFEITTAAAFVLFARHPADVLLLEVGLGGRLDATNVVDAPLATVITPISVDHVDYLGDSLGAIAREKAGILKRGVPAIIAPQAQVALDAIIAESDRRGAVLKIVGQDYMATEERGRLVYQDEAGLLDLPAGRLQGRHQIVNAGTAVATLRALPALGLPVGAYEEGLVRVDWPGRLQRLAQGRLIALAPAGSELWLDGAHNPEGGRALAAALADLEERVSRPLVLIVGMLATKDTDGFLANFSGLVRRVIAVPVNQEKGLPPEQIAAAAERAAIPARHRPNIEEALRAVAKLELDRPARIVITGSLYLAGEVLAANGTPPE